MFLLHAGLWLLTKFLEQDIEVLNHMELHTDHLSAPEDEPLQRYLDLVVDLPKADVQSTRSWLAASKISISFTCRMNSASATSSSVMFGQKSR